MATSILREPSVATPAVEAYEALAPFYDEFTADYEYEAWLEALEALARAHGLRGRRVLDVACGTGKSAAPLLARGYDVTACDVSPAMVTRARRRLGPAASVFPADMRALPPGGDFDLVTCLDDAVNYLLSEADLEAALRSFSGVLRPGGLAVFDVNSLSAFRRGFTSKSIIAADDAVFCWRGEAGGEVGPGAVCAVTIEILREGSDGDPEYRTSRHVQRHHPRESIEAACTPAGLRCVAVRGQVPGGRLLPDPDEEQHSKLVYLLQKPDAGGEPRGGDMSLFRS